MMETMPVKLQMTELESWIWRAARLLDDRRADACTSRLRGLCGTAMASPALQCICCHSGISLVQLKMVEQPEGIT